MPIDADARPNTDLLVSLLYDDLRRLARSSRWRVSAGGTLQTTALVHEAYLKLRHTPGFEDQQHFLRTAALAMRQILINTAREALADKRGGGAAHVSLDDAPEVAVEGAAELLEVNQLLDRLRGVSERLAQVVECRFFAGYGDQETAAALGLAERTVRRDWLKARAWMRHELSQGGTPTTPDETPP